MNHYLSLILFTPLAGALLLLLVNKQNENAIRWIANIVAFIGFVDLGAAVVLVQPAAAPTSSSSSGRPGFRRSAPSTSSASTA